MKIDVFYLNGRTKTFEIGSLSDSSPWKHDNGKNCCCDSETNHVVPLCTYDFRLDTLFENDKNNSQFLFVYIDFYDIEIDENKVNRKTQIFRDGSLNYEYSVCNKYPGRAIPICSNKELEEIAYISVDGETVFCNIDGDFINIKRLQNHYSSKITDDFTMALYDKILKLRIKMEKDSDGNDGQFSIERFAKEIGVTKELLDKVDTTSQNDKDSIKESNDEKIYENNSVPQKNNVTDCFLSNE